MDALRAVEVSSGRSLAQTCANHLFTGIILKNARRDSGGVIPDSEILDSGEASIWISVENEVLSCPLGGTVLTDWGRYPDFLGAVACPDGVSCLFGGSASSWVFAMLSPALSHRAVSQIAVLLRLGGTPWVHVEPCRNSILTFWGLILLASCPDLTRGDRSGTHAG